MKLSAATSSGQKRLEKILAGQNGIVVTIPLIIAPTDIDADKARRLDMTTISPRTHRVRKAGRAITLEDGNVARYFETVRQGNLLFIEDPAHPVCQFRQSGKELTFVEPRAVSIGHKAYYLAFGGPAPKSVRTVPVNPFVFDTLYRKQTVVYIAKYEPGMNQV